MRLASAVALLAAMPAVASAAAVCLPQDPSIVSLSGRIVQEVFPGPPNYKSVAEGDAPEHALMLELAQPVCVDGDPRPDAAPITRLQLTAYSPAEFKAYPGMAVTVSGTLFRSLAGHQHAEFLLHALSVQPDL